MSGAAKQGWALLNVAVGANDIVSWGLGAQANSSALSA